MGTDKSNNTLSLRRISIAVSLIAAVVFGAVSFPLVRERLDLRDSRRIEAIYADGLSPCEHYHSIDVGSVLEAHLPSAPSASITAWPSFSEPVAVRLVGNELYYFRLQFPPTEVETGLNARFELPLVRTVSQVRVSNDVASLLPIVLNGDVTHATAKLPLAVDGTAYYFQTSSENCAMAHSPKPDTRASRLVNLFGQLVELSEGGPSELVVREQKVLTSLKQL